jgi:hypothetical protein
MLFICERVEAFYRGTAGDDTVSRVMHMIVAAGWAAGAGALAVYWRACGIATRASDR